MQGASGGIAIGTKLPAAVAKTKMKNVDGKMLSIIDVTGKAGTLIVFTCNHCPFAKAWEQRIVELGNTYAGKGIGVILVNANDPTTHPEDGFEEMQARAKSRGLYRVTCYPCQRRGRHPKAGQATEGRLPPDRPVSGVRGLRLRVPVGTRGGHQRERVDGAHAVTAAQSSCTRRSCSPVSAS